MTVLYIALKKKIKLGLWRRLNMIAFEESKRLRKNNAIRKSHNTKIPSDTHIVRVTTLHRWNDDLSLKIPYTDVTKIIKSQLAFRTDFFGLSMKDYLTYLTRSSVSLGHPVLFLLQRHLVSSYWQYIYWYCYHLKAHNKT